MIPTDKLALGGVASLVNAGFVVVSLLFPFASSLHAPIVYVPSAVIVKLPLVPVIVLSVPAPVIFILFTLVFVLSDVSLTCIVTSPMWYPFLVFPLICMSGAFSSPFVVAVVVSLSNDAFPALSYAIAVILYV